MTPCECEYRPHRFNSAAQNIAGKVKMYRLDRYYRNVQDAPPNAPNIIFLRLFTKAKGKVTLKTLMSNENIWE